jgi:hypothetical protein
LFLRKVFISKLKLFSDWVNYQASPPVFQANASQNRIFFSGCCLETVLAAKFNDYEVSQAKALAKLAAVKADNKKLEWQRNTLLAIIITAILAITGFVVIKVLRVFKVLPF